MNEKRIQEVIEVEKQAQQLLATAKSEAEKLPMQAESEALRTLEEARASAQEEARRILEQVEGKDEAAEIMSMAQERMQQSERLATKNMEKAVAVVLGRVAGGA